MTFLGFSEKDISMMLPGSHLVARARFAQLTVNDNGKSAVPLEIGFLGDIKVMLQVCLGTKVLTLREILELKEGQVLELDRMAGEPVDVLVNGHFLATGEVVVINEVYGLRINNIMADREG